MLASFSWILPANGLGCLFIVLRIAFLEDVICANHIVQAVLMLSKPSAHSEFHALVLLRLMHMGFNPALDQGDAHAPLEPQHKVPRPNGRGLNSGHQFFGSLN
jgi:hypothetical protein